MNVLERLLQAPKGAIAGSLDAELAILRTLDHLIWALIAGAAVIVLAAPFGSNFYIDVNTFCAPRSA